MKTRILVLMICTAFLAGGSANAQVLKMLKNKGKKSGEEKKEGEVDKRMQKGILNLKNKLLGEEADSTAGEKAEAHEQNRGAMGALSNMLGGSDVAHKDSYNFDISISMDMETYDENEEVSGTMQYLTYINAGARDVAIDIKPQSEDTEYKADITMIYDMDNKAIFVLTSNSGQKMAMATSIDDVNDLSGEDEQGSTAEAPEYTKTGRTKKILGYKCSEYIVEDEDYTSEVWVTDELDFDPGHKQMKNAGIPVTDRGPFEGNMIMEMHSYEEGIKQMSMFVRDIDKKSNKSFTLEGYKIISAMKGSRK